MEDDEIVTDPSACAEILNNFFVNSIKNLDIDRGLHTVNITGITDDPGENAIEEFKRHPSITRINEEGFTQGKFSFQDVAESDISLVIKNIDSSKSYQKENIPPKLLKENNDICALYIIYIYIYSWTKVITKWRRKMKVYCHCYDYCLIVFLINCHYQSQQIYIHTYIVIY